MQLPQPTTAAALADRFGAELLGDGGVAVTGINEIHHVATGDLCFVDHPRYYVATLASAASVILIDRARECPPGKALLVHPEPFACYNRVAWGARPRVPWPGEGVAKSAKIGPGVSLAPGVVVGENVTIGNDCTLGPNCVIADGCSLGDRVTVGAGTLIGDEAFYYKRTAEGELLPWRSVGSVRVEDDVFLGPCCTIARGVSSTTVIGHGTKLDAQVQIGHDCRIGRHCLLAAQVGVAGNTTLGDRCILQGQVGIAQNITIGDGVEVFAQSGVGKDLEGGRQYFGSPAQEARKAFRELIELRRLADR